MEESPFAQWLLSARTPSIRLLTLTQLLDHPLHAIEVRASWGTMKASGPIPAILSHQTKTGNWSGEKSFYTPKYVSSHWNMVLMAELAADPQDARVRRGAIYMLGTTWESLENRIAEKNHSWTCLWANILFYSLHCQLADDPRVRTITHALAADALQSEWRCRYNDDRPCAWGVVRTLLGLSAIPENRRNDDVLATIQSGIHFLLEEHDLLQANFPVPENGSIHPLWFKLNFPLFYQTDILFTLRTLAALKLLHHLRAQAALDWLESQRQKNGTWRGSSPFRSRTWEALGDRDETDRWVSLHAALILKAAGRFNAD